jgi:hypothetical protein
MGFISLIIGLVIIYITVKFDRKLYDPDESMYQNVNKIGVWVFFVFYGCKSQNTNNNNNNNNNNFIYHTADYNLGALQEELLYNSFTGIYEYRKISDNKIVKNIKIFLKFDSKNLEDINKLHTSSKSEMSNCYFENNVIVYKSTITFNSSKDKFSSLDCKGEANPIFDKTKNKIEGYITSSSIYKTTFYWEFYKK